MASSASKPPPSPQPDPQPETPAGPRRLIFTVGGLLLACDVTAVREIVRPAPVTRYPGAPPFVRGLTNLRGDVLTVVDLGVRLSAEGRPVEGGRFVVAQAGDQRLVLAVDEVREVREMAEEGSERPGADQPRNPAPELLRPVGHLDGQIVLLMDISALLRETLI